VEPRRSLATMVRSGARPRGSRSLAGKATWGARGGAALHRFAAGSGAEFRLPDWGRNLALGRVVWRAWSMKPAGAADPVSEARWQNSSPPPLLQLCRLPSLGFQPEPPRLQSRREGLQIGRAPGDFAISPRAQPTRGAQLASEDEESG
jgi:hypothetical protein